MTIAHHWRSQIVTSNMTGRLFAFLVARFSPYNVGPQILTGGSKMSKSILISIDKLEKMIYSIRGDKVMLDRDLAELYGVSTKALKQAVRRNIKRFPADFMFVLSSDELNNWRSQFVTSSGDRKGLRYAPMAFTEHGVLMLSSVLKSDRAVQVNIEIMRTFLRLRRKTGSKSNLAKRVDQLERRYDGQFKVVFDAIRKLLDPKRPTRSEIGFRAKMLKP
jgi:hypothetical protein